MDIVRIGADCDWITATLPHGKGVNLEMEFERAARLAADDAAHHDTRERSSIMGYIGWRQGSVRYGERHDGQLIMATGQAGSAVCDRLGTEGVHVARLDLQVTSWLAEDHADLARTLADQAFIARENGYCHHAMHINHINGYGNGDSCYLGSRASDSYLVCYDKWREKGDDLYEFAWRFEARFKNKRATEVFGLMQSAHNRGDFCKDYVGGWLVSRGLAHFRYLVKSPHGTYTSCARAFYNREPAEMD